MSYIIYVRQHTGDIHMAHTFFAVYVHIVFSTKNRRRLLDAQVEPRIHAYLAAAVNKSGCKTITVGGCPDHVHMLVGLDQQVAAADLIKEVKRQSSLWAKEEFPTMAEFSWQEGYAAFSVSYSNLTRVRAYIHRQAEHHKKMDWETELRGLLKKHGIAFDERFFLG